MTTKQEALEALEKLYSVVPDYVHDEDFNDYQIEYVEIDVTKQLRGIVLSYINAIENSPIEIDVTIGKWIAVAERMPEHGQPVVVAAYSEEFSTWQYDLQQAVAVLSPNGWFHQWTNIDDGSMLQDVTHWAPLPASPKKDDVDSNKR